MQEPMKDVIARDFEIGQYVIYAHNKRGKVRMMFGKIKQIDAKQSTLFVKTAWWNDKYNMPNANSEKPLTQIWPTLHPVLINNDIPEGIKRKLDE